jgi:hypothetical protein
MESFKASVQYGDWEGTAAADDAHQNLHGYLEGNLLITANDFLVATSLYVDEDYANVEVFVFEGRNDFESVKAALAATKGPVPVRKVNVKLTPKEFIRLFKRLSVVLTSKDLGLKGREYVVVEN